MGFRALGNHKAVEICHAQSVGRLPSGTPASSHLEQSQVCTSSPRLVILVDPGAQRRCRCTDPWGRAPGLAELNRNREKGRSAPLVGAGDRKQVLLGRYRRPKEPSRLHPGSHPAQGSPGLQSLWGTGNSVLPLHCRLEHLLSPHASPRF